MRRAKVYRNVGLQPQWLGLEPIDLLALGGLGWTCLSIMQAGLASTALVLAAAYVGMRLFKRGKPPGYTLQLLRFALARRSVLSAAEPDRRSVRFIPTP